MTRRLLACITMTAVVVVLAASAQSSQEIQAPVSAAHSKYRNLKEGKNADYIPALAKVGSNLFGIAVVTLDGKTYTAGDLESEVSIQSISKVFTLANVLQESGTDAVRDSVRAQKAITDISNALHGNPYAPKTEGKSN